MQAYTVSHIHLCESTHGETILRLTSRFTLKCLKSYARGYDDGATRSQFCELGLCGPFNGHLVSLSWKV